MTNIILFTQTTYKSVICHISKTSKHFIFITAKMIKNKKSIEYTTLD